MNRCNFLCGSYGELDQSFEHCDLAHIRWINSSNLLAVRALHPLVVDEKTRWLGPTMAVGGCELNRCIGHCETGVCVEERGINRVALKTSEQQLPPSKLRRMDMPKRCHVMSPQQIPSRFPDFQCKEESREAEDPGRITALRIYASPKRESPSIPV